MLTSLSDFSKIAKSKEKKTLVLAAAEDNRALDAVAAAKREGLVDAILVGSEVSIIKIAEEIEFDLSGTIIIDEKDPATSCKIAVEQIRAGNAHILMKGLVSTADFLRAILDKEKGLRTGRLLSHVGFFEIDKYKKLLGLTDAAQNIYPDLNEKVGIIKNAVDMFRRLGVDNPKVALLGAVEVVNPKMPSTIDSAAITQMNRRGQIKGCVIDGPLAFDNAISEEATKHKGIVSDVAGDADLIVPPNIEVANSLYKSFTYFGGAAVAAIILGAAAPIVLTSRADSEKSKLSSIALAASY